MEEIIDAAKMTMVRRTLSFSVLAGLNYPAAMVISMQVNSVMTGTT
jgi:hypothetical protein